MSRIKARIVTLVVVAFTMAGCASIGPRTVAVDRFDYSSAMAESWKQQTLLNIVKLRYVDLPVFVDVASVVAGYSLQTGVTVNGVVSSTGAVQGNYGGLGAQGVFTDRPTITYVPLTGEKFLRGLITPIDPKNIFFMLQAGYSADFILALTVESLNGVRNRAVASGAVRPADPEFVRVLGLLRDLQGEGAFSMRVEENKANGSTAVLLFRREGLSQETRSKGAELRQLLGMPPDVQRFELVYSPVRGSPEEMTVNSRSMLQILTAFASFVDVPQEHIDRQMARASLQTEDQLVGRIRSGRERPESAYAAVEYRGYWFWVEDGDFPAKRALMAVMFFFTLADTGGAERLPLVTIPAQ
jgi:uncharacterized protein YceK